MSVLDSHTTSTWCDPFIPYAKAAYLRSPCSTCGKASTSMVEWEWGPEYFCDKCGVDAAWGELTLDPAETVLYGQ